jgi:urea transporter
MAQVIPAPTRHASGAAHGTGTARRRRVAAAMSSLLASSGVVEMGESLLRVYAHILFSRSPAVGLLVMLATATVPRAFVFGVIAACAANGTALLLDLEKDAVRDGSYAYNALLVGLGVAQSFTADGPAVAVALLGAAACVVVTAALRSLTGSGPGSGGAAGLPVLSLPFIVVFHLTLSTSAFSGLTLAAPAQTPSAFEGLPAPIALFARCLGGLFFLPRADAGALVLAALLVHSRIAALLAALAFAAALGLASRWLSLPDGALDVLGYNAVLTAVGLGGVWFVPSASSFALGLSGAALAALVTAGAMAPLARLGAAPLILPFNVTVAAVLLAMRRRARDERPKAVDFLPGTPEQNLAYLRTRRARFQQSPHGVSFRLPFRGTWTCTQAVDGAFTHKEQWRYAFDFQVMGEDGRAFRGAGSAPQDFHCHRLPVVAAADGTVVKVESSVPDSDVGAMNLEQNWGNHVIVAHAPGVYSMVAHLARGTLKVVEGQWVKRGDVLGLAGSSGRSPEPHLHFQLQSTHKLGAPTLPCRFSDVVTVGEEARLWPSLEPREGDAVRSIEADEDVSAYFGFTCADTWAYRVGAYVERVTCDVDVYGRLLIRSEDRAASLFYGRSDDLFTSFDAVGDDASVVHLLRAALPRVPLEGSASLRWADTLPARRFRAFALRVLADFVAPFLPGDGIEMDLRMRREGDLLVVLGESRRRDRRGEPLVRTRAELTRGRGPLRVEVTAQGRTRAAERVEGAGSRFTVSFGEETS